MTSTAWNFNLDLQTWNCDVHFGLMSTLQGLAFGCWQHHCQTEPSDLSVCRLLGSENLSLMKVRSYLISEVMTWLQEWVFYGTSLSTFQAPHLPVPVGRAAAGEILQLWRPRAGISRFFLLVLERKDTMTVLGIWSLVVMSCKNELSLQCFKLLLPKKLLNIRNNNDNSCISIYEVWHHLLLLRPFYHILIKKFVPFWPKYLTGFIW